MKLALVSMLALFSPLALAAINISLGGLVEAVVWLIVAGLIVGLLLWAVAKAPFIDETWKTAIRYFIYFVCVILAINFLLSIIGSPMFTLR